ncbi:LptF/LptG family permease [Albimonas pacifica]|uniref:Lipopolysaccharide export system permease protein n=1 Tax=Albimonas pacifica TaxID=1114924 RepID=A0A1I3BPW7_9RHOB|nr:LptF/LptG family permease [Albimonas pacifica]SFH64348.1 lipopolysaccharide export system permease protein [Albimonas pacifica]
MLGGVADRHLLRLMLPRMAQALLIAMGALLIERLLRLFDLVAGAGVGVAPLLGMLASLLPHYLGLALPLAFAIGTLGVLASLCQNNEADVLEAAGWSVRRIGAVFVLCGGLLAMLSLILFGYVQPYSRYAYRTLAHALSEGGWVGPIEQNVFLHVGDDLIISAEDADPTGLVLSRVFVVERRDGQETATTAAHAVVDPRPAQGVVGLILFDGTTMLAGGARLDFTRLRLEHEFDLAQSPFRPRGGSERELTLSELSVRMTGEDGLPPEARYATEFHARIARSVSMIAVALLSVPLGVSRKRSPTWPRIAIAVAILTGFHHLLLFAETLGTLGRMDPALAVWSVTGGFLLLSGWLYMSTQSQGSRSSLRLVLRAIDRVRPAPRPDNP